MGNISRLKEDLEHKITTWQPQFDLNLMRSVCGANVEPREEDELSDECLLTRDLTGEATNHQALRTGDGHRLVQRRVRIR